MRECYFDMCCKVYTATLSHEFSYPSNNYSFATLTFMRYIYIEREGGIRVFTNDPTIESYICRKAFNLFFTVCPICCTVFLPHT